MSKLKLKPGDDIIQCVKALGLDPSLAFQGQDLKGFDLSHSDFSHFNFSATSLNGAVLCHSNLSGADLSEADLSGAQLSEVMLRGADLSGADLQGATLERTDLSGANFSGAIVRGAVLSSCEGLTEETILSLTSRGGSIVDQVLVKSSGKPFSWWIEKVLLPVVLGLIGVFVAVL